MSSDRKNFDPQLDMEVNVTKIFEDRHINRAVFAISLALENYLPTFSSDQSGCYTEKYYWVCIGTFPISKTLREVVSKKFIVNNGELLFKTAVQMKSEYPEVFSHFHSIHRGNDFSSFVGLPLPEDDFEEDCTTNGGKEKESFEEAPAN